MLVQKKENQKNNVLLFYPLKINHIDKLQDLNPNLINLIIIKNFQVFSTNKNLFNNNHSYNKYKFNTNNKIYKIKY